jgi:NAD(P)H dehydrogenase (quinone)
MTKKTIVVAYHSTYGHTKRQADAIAQGVEKAGCISVSINVGNIITPEDNAWEILDNADAIIFGSPTYMGSVSAEFKKFADLSSKKWFTQAWKNKITGGFTNSASMNGDKFSTIQYLWTLAMQHGMIWVSLGLLPANSSTSTRNDINFLGGSAGALATSVSDGNATEHPPKGDIDTAILYGERIAHITQAMHIS